MNSVKRYVASSLDSIWPPVKQSWIICFPCDDTKKKGMFHVLRRGLARTIEQRPYLAGHLAFKDGRLQLTYRNLSRTSIPINMNDLTRRPNDWHISYEELRKHGMPISYLLPIALEPEISQDVFRSSPIVAQANFIAGGCLLAICLNHGIADGPPQSSFIAAWAQNCKALQDSQGGQRAPKEEDFTSNISKNPDGNPSTILRLPNALREVESPDTNEEKERIKHSSVLWQLLGLQKEVSGSLARVVPQNTVTAIFAASRLSIARLKKESSKGLKGGSSESYISSFDAEAALLWRCIMRARRDDLEPTAKKTSRIRIPVSLRSTFGIPGDFPGNVFLNSVTELPLDFLVGQRDGRHVAPMIRLSVEMARNARLARDAIKLSRMLPDLGSRVPLFRNTMVQDLVMTSWRDMALYHSDWGPLFSSTGMPDFVRIPAGHRPGLCALLPRRDQKEVEVLLDMEKNQFGRLVGDVEFREYYELRSA